MGLPALNNSYVYALFDPESGLVFYIGQSKDPNRRLAQHMTGENKTYNKKLAAKLESLTSKGLRPVILLLDEAPSPVILEIENHWIAHFRNLGVTLLNILKNHN